MDGVYVTDDAWLAGYLISRGAHLGEPIVERGNVVFRVEGPGVAEDAELFLRGQAVANVHALKTGMNLAKDFIAATKRRGNGNGGGPGRAVRPFDRGSESGNGGATERERESARRGERGERGHGQAQA